MKTRLVSMTVLALGTLLMSATAHAGLLTFSDRTAFLAAAGGGLASIDFDGLGGNSYQTLSSVVDSSIAPGVTFSSTGGNPSDLFVAPAGFSPGIASDTLFANFFGTPLIADFAPLVNSIGADVNSYPAGNIITIDVRDAGGITSSFVFNPSPDFSGFFGVIGTSGTTIDRISFAPAPGFTAGVDNFLFGQAASVPAPGAIVAFGVGALAHLRRRKRS